MRKRGILMLGLALAFAVIAVVMARGWLEQRMRPVILQQEPPPTKTVIVARSPLEFGNRIGPEHVRAIQWPSGNVPEGAFESVEALFPDGERRVVLRKMEAYEPILDSKISGQGGRATLSAIIAEDMRAITIRVNDIHGVAGFVMPGDRVDVLLTRAPEKSAPITDVLLQNIKVLGIDQEASEDKEKPKVARAVTLEVTAQQAQKLTLAGEVGTLSLALRNRLNASAETVRTVTLRDLRVGEVNEPQTPEEKIVATPSPKPKTAVRRTVPRPSNPFASVNVVRGLKPSRYEVTEEKAAPPSPVRPTASTPTASERRPEKALKPAPVAPEPGNELQVRDRETAPVSAPAGLPISLLPTTRQ